MSSLVVQIRRDETEMSLTPTKFMQSVLPREGLASALQAYWQEIVAIHFLSRS